MPAKLGILVVHGMGSQTAENFDERSGEMIARIGRELREHGADTEALFWERAYWGDILQSHQNELLNAKLKYSKLNWMWLRHFVIDNLGDAVAYQRDPTDPENFYSQIHRRIHEKIVELRRRLGHDGLLVIMAHSLGSYIISNYIWDRQKPMKYIPESNRPAEEEYRGTPFECMDTLATLITFGSNIAIFSLALDPYVGITFPPERLAAPFQPLARWLNFYDPDDVLGYPIKPLCPEYRDNPRIEDCVVDAGGILTRWNPFSHDRYWTDADFVESVANQIAKLLQRL